MAKVVGDAVERGGDLSLRPLLDESLRRAVDADRVVRAGRRAEHESVTTTRPQMSEDLMAGDTEEIAAKAGRTRSPFFVGHGRQQGGLHEVVDSFGGAPLEIATYRGNLRP